MFAFRGTVEHQTAVSLGAVSFICILAAWWMASAFGLIAQYLPTPRRWSTGYITSGGL